MESSRPARRRIARRVVPCAAAAAVLAVLAPAGVADPAPYGLESPVAVGPYLNGVFPSQRPTDPSTSTWTVVPAFPNLSFDDTTVIASPPATAGAWASRLAVGSRAGVISWFENDPATALKTPFLDLSDRVAVVWDGGFLGLAFHPEFAQPASPHRGDVYVYYSSHCPLDATRTRADLAACDQNYPGSSTGGFFGTYLRLSRYRVPDGAVAADPASEEILINIRLYNGSHRGGGLTFDDDGLLLLSIGDQFRYTTAQDLDTNLEGGVMRLDVNGAWTAPGVWQCASGASHLPIRRFDTPDEISGRGYCIPNDNPFVDATGVRFEEYFTIGHRAPHRLTRDVATGRLWVGEVGESTREEINVLRAGGNYGWPFREGLTAGPRSQPTTILGTLTDPILDFPRSEANAVIGGYVYRGARLPELAGRYLCGDYATRNVWAVAYDETTGLASKTLLTTFPGGALATWGQDNAGEVYLGGLGAGRPLYTLARVGAPVPDPPAWLSQLGAFSDLGSLTPAPFLVPFEMNAPLWSDGSLKKRWIALPSDGVHDTPAEQIGWSETGDWTYPPGTVLVKHFELPIDAADPSRIRRLETRFQVMAGDGTFYGLTYRWLPDGTDAQLLVDGATEDVTVETAGGPRTQTWTYPSRIQCRSCHADSIGGGALGPRTHQLHGDATYPATGRTDDQLRTWTHLGMLSPAPSEAAIPGMLRARGLGDPTASLEDRARSWLDANCSSCHRPGTGNRAAFDTRLTTPLLEQGLVYGGVASDLGVPGSAVVTPGDLVRSVLYHRVAALGPVAMPPLAKNLVHDEAVEILSAWIARISPGFPQQGLSYAYYQGAWSVLPNFGALTPVATGYVGSFDLSPRLRNDDFAFRFSGKIRIDTAGAWTFYTSSDDGSRLFVNGTQVVDNDGLHGTQERSGTITLAAGYHDVEVRMFERTGAEVLVVSYEGPGVSKRVIPGSVLYRETPIVPPNAAPAIPTPSDPGGREGGAVSRSFAASDPESDDLYYTAEGLPPGLALDRETGLVTGTLPHRSRGVHRVTIGVSDGPNAAHTVFDWTVGAAECDDGIDNDGDGATDYDGAGVGPPDSTCLSNPLMAERPSTGCGLGPELALALPLLGALRRRSRRWAR